MIKEDYLLYRYGSLDIIEAFLGPEKECRICISTRRGGVSFDNSDLNLSIGTGDEEENVCRNRDIIGALLGTEGSKVAGLSQVHGKEILKVNKSNLSKFLLRKNKADGMITTLKSQWLSISIGDCQPIAIFDSGKKQLAMLHAGWGGTALKIAEEAVKLMLAGGSRVENLYALLGPCIRSAVYQVDARVFEEFEKNWSSWKEFINDPSDGHGYIDISAANKSLLSGIGIPPGQISEIDLCTHSLPSLFFSHRRDGLPGGRMFAFGMISERS